MDYIGFCNYNGSQRYNVLRDGGKIRHPFSIALFEDTLFWSDWDRKQVKRGNKFHGGDAALIHAALFRPMDLHVVHPVQQPRGKGLCHAMSECLVVNRHPMRDCIVSLYCIVLYCIISQSLVGPSLGRFKFLVWFHLSNGVTSQCDFQDFPLGFFCFLNNNKNTVYPKYRCLCFMPHAKS